MNKLENLKLIEKLDRSDMLKFICDLPGQCRDAYKVGKLNHGTSAVDWRAFGIASVRIIREAVRALYVKADLRPFLPPGFLSAAECDMDTLTLPARPQESELCLT